jgi:hypothetical protein
VNTTVIKPLFSDLKFFYCIINKLQGDGFIEIFTNDIGNESYQCGHFCKKYRLTSNLNLEEWKVIKVSATGNTCTRKVVQFATSNWKTIDFKLYNLLTQINIDTIDFFENTTVTDFSDSTYSEVDVIRDIAEKKNKKRDDRCLNDIMIDVYSFYKDAYLSIRDGNWRYNVDEHGRRHTNITNLPKLLRGHLYVIKEGVKKRLMTVDVSNSQVLLLLTLLPKNLRSYTKFKQLVESGKFYDFFADELGIVMTPENRNKIKEQYFTFIYGEHWKPYVWGSKAYKIMKQEFPDIVRFIIQYKNRYGYEKPAHKMQEAESNIIMDICSIISKEHLFHNQIYDSILCLKEDIIRVQDIMKDVFKRHGLNVNLKVEDNSLNVFTKTLNEMKETKLHVDLQGVLRTIKSEIVLIQ